MASADAIAATALSLQELLSRCFADAGDLGDPPPRAFAVQTEDFGGQPRNQAFATAQAKVSIYTYRLELNPTTRAAWSAIGSLDGQVHVPVDIHVLLTAWATNAETELRLLGHTMACLERTPVLSGPLLHPSGGWSPGEAIQITRAELDLESTLRAFSALPTDHRLSIGYVARVARIDAPDRVAPGVTTVVAGAKP